MCHHPKTPSRSILPQWVMIVWNIIRFVCGLPPGEHRDWWGSGVLMNFSLAPDIEMIEYGNFCRIGQIDWLSLSQCTFTREKRRWKSHDLQKCNLKIESFLAIFHAYWQITQSGHLFIHWEPFASDLPKKTLIHTTSQCIFMQTQSLKKIISIKLVPSLVLSTVISDMMYWLKLVDTL